MLDIDLKSFNPPFFIHSDILRSHEILREFKIIDKKVNICKQHYDLLKQNLSEEDLIFPAFNYDFGKKLVFDRAKDQVQVGSLPEWVRTNTNFTRSPTPFFSILSKNKLIEFNSIQYPFGNNSIFSKMFELNGTFIFYGINYTVFTAIHFLETKLGPPVYRYDKSFEGKIIDNKIDYSCTVNFHVRPKNTHLEYDWNKMQSDMLKEGVLHKSKNFEYLYFCKSNEVYNFYKKKLSQDIFYMLDKESSQLFSKLTEKGKKRLKQKNHE